MTTVITKEQEFYSNFNKNILALNSARRIVNSQINNFLRKDDDYSVKIYTNIYLLIYSSWTEANLVKLIHTPFGFTDDQKTQILKGQDVLNKWKKCVSTAFSKFSSKGSEIPNKKRKIIKIVDGYLKTQANIRNKFAHGQWVFPLFKNNIKHDPDIEIMIKLIDIIEIDTWFEVVTELIEIVRGLIDARPVKNYLSHYNEYYLRLENINNIISKKRTWSIEEKKKRLKLKKYDVL